MAATLVLRTVKGTPLTNLEVDNNFSNLNTFGDVVSSNIGVLSALTTANKSNIVIAINEINSNAANIIIIDDTTTNDTFFPTLVTVSSGNANVKVSSTKLTFNPSSGLLTSTDYNSSSDMTLKQDFIPINNSLDIISQLTGFGFTWKESKEKAYGLSAQEVEKVIPEIVRDRPDGTKGINYMNLTAFLVEAIKDLKQEIEELKKPK
jgi:hypothetical protein